MKAIMKKINMKYLLGCQALGAAAFMSNSAFAISMAEFKTNADNSSQTFGQVFTYVCWFIAGALLAVMAWNMYKSSKNPNGNEKGIAMGCLIGAVLFLGIPEIAGLGTDAVFGSEEAGSSNVRVGKS